MPKPYILCVDDERTVLNSLRQELEHVLGNQYVFELAESAEEGLEILRELVAENKAVHVVISDQIMPGMKGDQFLVRVNDINPHIRKILLTGQATADAVGNAVNKAGLYRYIAKPWDQQDLRLTITQAAESYLQEAELATQVKVLDDLNRSAQLLAEVASPDVLADRLLTSALADTGSVGGLLWLVPEGGNTPLMYSAHNAGHGPDSQAITPSDAAKKYPMGWVEQVWQAGKMEVEQNASDKSPIASNPVVKSRKLKSVVAVPLQSGDDTPMGVLYLEVPDKPFFFSEDKLEFLELLAGYAAVCFNNAWLYENLEKTVASRTETLSERNRSMRENIEYARRIQLSILPPLEILTARFPQSFVLFQPKDVVSGDFYFLAEHEGRFYAAAVDCTGHGVPGAFVSVLGSNLLNQALRDQNKTNPADILNWVHRTLRATLKQYEESASVQDGMDLALVCLEPDGKTLVFAGAKRPLWHFRGDEITEYKADRYPIGGSVYDLSADADVFSSQVLEIEQGDRIYMFTDGPPDQFGGPDGTKKFSTRTVRELFQQSQNLPVSEQGEVIRKALAAWQGEQPQTDDRLVIGIEF